MIKKLLSVLVIAASLAACTKEAQNASQPEEIAGGKLIVRATSPVTRLTFTENGTGGYSTTFTDNTDHLWGYFRNGSSMVNYTNTSDAQASRMFLQLDESTLSADHKSASFKSDCKVIPATATNIFFYLDNNASPITYNSTPTFCDLHSQSGKLADANLLHVIVGNTDISAMTTDTDGNKVADIAFEYKTSIIKVCITFPAGVTPTADDATTITISDSDVYNKVHISWGEPGASSTKGDISFHPESVSGQVATAYITVWENTKFDGATITAVAGGKACRADLTAAQTIEAGKVYSLSRTVQVGAYDKWTADAASSEVFIAGLTVDTNTATWLSYDASTGAVAWTENTTGAPRVGTITFTTGETAKVTQFEAKDFAGAWTIKADTRTPAAHGAAVKATSTVAGTGGNPVGYGGTASGRLANSWYDDAWTTPSSGAGKTTNLNLTYTGAANQISISGLIDGLTMPAKVVIDYDSKTATFQPYVENVTYLQGSGAEYEGEYLAFATELRNIANATSGGKTIVQPWQLGFGNGGTFYFPCPVTVSDGGLVATFSGTAKCTTYTTYNVVGLLVNRYVASGTAGGNLIRSTKSVWAYSQATSGGAAYAKVFQGAMTFTKQ